MHRRSNQLDSPSYRGANRVRYHDFLDRLGADAVEVLLGEHKSERLIEKEWIAAGGAIEDFERLFAQAVPAAGPDKFTHVFSAETAQLDSARIARDFRQYRA